MAKYSDLRNAGLSTEACVALVTGAVVTTHAEVEQPTRAAANRETEDLAVSIEERLDVIDEEQKQRDKLRKRKDENPFGREKADDEDDDLLDDKE